MRLGLYGGTFDPPHEGHLTVVRTVVEALALDRLEVVPACEPPHRHRPEAGAIDRYAMVALALAEIEDERIVPSPREIRRGGVSYTIDTIDEVERELPGTELVLVVGADSYDDLPSWREAAQIVRRAHLAVLPRPGSRGALEPRDEDRDRLRPPGDAPPDARKALWAVPMPEQPVAASAIRHTLHEGPSGDLPLPEGVRRYIRKRGLYRNTEGGARG